MVHMGLVIASYKGIPRFSVLKTEKIYTKATLKDHQGCKIKY